MRNKITCSVVDCIHNSSQGNTCWVKVTSVGQDGKCCSFISRHDKTIVEKQAASQRLIDVLAEESRRTNQC